MAQHRDGFTLIELAVVVFTIAILIAVGIPTLTGFRNRAFDVDAQSELRLAMTAERIHHQDNGLFTESAADLRAIEVLIEINVAGDPVGTVRAVVATVAGTDAVCLFSVSQSGTWWSLYVDATSGTKYGSVAPATCQASLASGWPTDGWA